MSLHRLSPTRLALPLGALVSVLLCAQWPLREAGSFFGGDAAGLANDTAQALFALYVALAVRHAGTRAAHVSATSPDASEARSAFTRWRRAGAPAVVLAWSAYVGYSAAPSVWRSLLQLERFPETLHPGYFLIKLALMVLALGLALQASGDLHHILRRSPA